MGNVTGLILSFVLILFIIFLSELLVKLFRLPKEESRKFVHIGVCHWWLLAMLSFDSWKWAIIPPIAFIFLNLISWYTGLFSAMERNKRSVNDLGTVYFPISLLILVLLTWHDSPLLSETTPFIGALGIIAMGYGDGFAALIGTRFGRRRFKILGSEKSLEGTAAMFLASLLSLGVLITVGTDMALPAALGWAGAMALLATAVEALTPRGLDNLTVPIIVSLSWMLFAL